MSDQKEQKHTVGVEVPDRMFQIINLAAIHLGTSKSQILRNAIRRWAEENTLSPNGLAMLVTKVFQDQWDKKKLDLAGADVDKHFTLFIGRCRTELNRKNVDKDILNQVIKKIQR